jgi:hypothetical protein
MMRPMAALVSLRLFLRTQSIELGIDVHLSLRDFEALSLEDGSSWRRYVRCPHLLFCAKCRKELKSYGEDRSLISDIKSAYAREEKIHLIRTSRRVSTRQ